MSVDLKKIMEQYEIEGRFNEELTPPDVSNVQADQKEYPYIKKGFFTKLDTFFKRLFIINPFIRKKNRLRKVEVIGKENLKGIKSGLVTCNHVDMFDCFAVKKALKPSRAKFVVADFNVRNDNIIHRMMQVEGILPLSNTLKGMRAFENAMDYYLKKNEFVAIYPEQCLWPMYEKPRPYKKGAFKYVVKFDVPIIPMFITYRNSGKLDEKGEEFKYFTIHVMPALYADKNLNKVEQVEDLKKRNYQACVNKYEEVYKKKMEYLTK